MRLLLPLLILIGACGGDSGWVRSFDEALELAAAENTLVMIDFYSDT